MKRKGNHSEFTWKKTHKARIRCVVNFLGFFPGKFILVPFPFYRQQVIHGIVFKITVNSLKWFFHLSSINAKRIYVLQFFFQKSCFYLIFHCETHTVSGHFSRQMQHCHKAWNKKDLTGNLGVQIEKPKFRLHIPFVAPSRHLLISIYYNNTHEDRAERTEGIAWYSITLLGRSGRAVIELYKSNPVILICVMMGSGPRSTLPIEPVTSWVGEERGGRRF